MSVSVEQVAGERGMRDFIRFPLDHYAGDPLYVPHLISERRRFFSARNPLFEFTEAAYFLARLEGRLVGRVSAHISSRQNERTAEPTGCFGFYEAVDDPAVARVLMESVEGWLAERGSRVVLGPLNFSTNEECGFLAEGFDRSPAIMMPYTKPYYLDQMADLGYGKARDLVSYRLESDGTIPEHLARFSRRAEERFGVRVRSLDMRRFEDEVRVAFDVYNRAWADNWGYVPMTDGQFRYMAEELKPVVVPDLALIAELDREVVGFSLALPDLAPVFRKMKGRLLPFGIFHFLFGRRHVHAVRVLTTGVVEEHRRKGVDVLLIHRTFANGFRLGYFAGEFGWILEDNLLMRRTLDRMGARVDKTYRIFEKRL
jgi:GNAT superfamily N-acetyltransferase